jgi:hypothetical protein
MAADLRFTWTSSSSEFSDSYDHYYFLDDKRSENCNSNSTNIDYYSHNEDTTATTTDAVVSTASASAFSCVGTAANTASTSEFILLLVKMVSLND